jgi:hypothetical protein
VPKILSQYCKTVCGHLESNLRATQVLSWSDVFANVGNARSKSRIAFGINQRQYTPIAIGYDGLYTDLLTCTFELQCDLFGVNGKVSTHDEAMDFAYQVEREILYGYQPYAEFTPLRPTRGGNIRLDQREGRYTYSSELTAAIAVGVSRIDTLTPILELVEPEIIGLNLINAWSGAAVNANDATLTYNSNNS